VTVYFSNIQEVSYDVLCRKSQLCRNFRAYGSCEKGDDCNYAHGREQLETKLCGGYYLSGRCKAAHGSCRYRHWRPQDEADRGEGWSGPGRSPETISFRYFASTDREFHRAEPVDLFPVEDETRGLEPAGFVRAPTLEEAGGCYAEEDSSGKIGWEAGGRSLVGVSDASIDTILLSLQSGFSRSGRI
jgi:hypothetical protein